MTQTTSQANYRRPEYLGESVTLKQSEDVSIGLIIGCAQHMQADKSMRYDLCILDLDQSVVPVVSIPMPFFGHGVVPDPANPHLVSVFAKRGPGACEIDIKEGRVTRIIPTAENRQFYGHGAYSHDGKLLYCTETIVEGDYKGLIAVRDARTHEYLGEMPSFGSSPHDCKLLDDGKTMVITNGGGPLDGIPPSVTYVDVASESLIEKVEFDADHVNAGHLDITSTGKLAVVSAQREGMAKGTLGGISIRNGDQLHTLAEPQQVIERLFDESLSVCINEEKGIVGATTPEGNLLTFWNIDSGELLHYYIMRNPRGIELSLDGKYFVVSYGMQDPEEAMCLFDSSTLAHVPGSDLQYTGITGSHLTAYAFPKGMRQ